jgi:hypothetical protein
MQVVMAKAAGVADQTDVIYGNNLLAEIGRIRADAERLQLESENRRDLRGALRAIHERLAIVELEAKLSGHIDTSQKNVTINVQAISADEAVEYARDILELFAPSTAPDSAPVPLMIEGGLGIPAKEDAMLTEASTAGLPALEKAALLRSQLADRWATDFAAFVKKAWRVIHPTRPLVWSWHYDLLCEYLTAVKQRNVTRLIINVPPRTAKSTIATICFPCWVWASDPSQSFLSAAWTEPFIEQITMFPNARNDDMADMMSQAAAWLALGSASTVTISNAFTGAIIARY